MKFLVIYFCFVVIVCLTDALTSHYRAINSNGICHEDQPYKLTYQYVGEDFFNESNFMFFTSNDPGHGFVDYLTKTDALLEGLITSKGNRALIYADTKQSVAQSARGRKSVRLETRQLHEKGLLVLSLNHMPEGMGTSPAFWTFNNPWPDYGEIDIIEGSNNDPVVRVALHTATAFESKFGFSNLGCAIYTDTPMTANWGYRLCGYPEPFEGCHATSSTPNSFGPGFNRNGGGTFAMEFDRTKWIKIWFFPKNGAPSDIDSTPDPLKWPLPIVHLPLDSSSGCDGTLFFGAQRAVLSLTFCNEFGGKKFPGGHAECINHVRNNPEAFKDAYWDLNYLKFYEH